MGYQPAAFYGRRRFHLEGGGGLFRHPGDGIVEGGLLLNEGGGVVDGCASRGEGKPMKWIGSVLHSAGCGFGAGPTSWTGP